MKRHRKTVSLALAFLCVSAGALAAGVFSTAATALGSPASAPVVGGGISVRPVHQNAHAGTAASSYFTLRGLAGSTLRDAAEVTNTGTRAVRLIVSAVDGLTGQTSGSVFGNRQDRVQVAGRWVTPSVARLELAGGASRVVPFTVRVPATASAGDHLAGIAFENAQPTVSRGNLRIREVLRSVIGVLTVVPGPAVFHPLLTGLGLAQLGSTRIASVSVGLGDDGAGLGKPELTVALSGPRGYQRTVTRMLDTVLPANVITYPFAWPDSLAAGEYDIAATLTGGGASVRLERHVRLGAPLVGVSQAPLPSAAAGSRHGGLSGYWLSGILAATALFGLLAGLLLRRRPRPPPHVSRHAARGATTVDYSAAEESSDIARRNR
jgi:hypothetical protein